MNFDNSKRCFAKINLDELEQNIAKIKKSLNGKYKYLSVIKADAYGHCMPQSVSRIVKAGVDGFCVANSKEAISIREVNSNLPIIILSPILDNEIPSVLYAHAQASVSSLDQAIKINNQAKKLNTTAKIQLAIDTGMGRAGIWFEKAKEIIPEILKLKNLCIGGLFTHFSSVANNKEFTFLQRQRLLEIFEFIGSPKDILLHCHASAAIEYLDEKEPFNAVRIGLIQFGAMPSNFEKLKNIGVKPVLSFYAKISHIRKSTDKVIAAVSAGFGDGIPSNIDIIKAYALIGDKKCPYVSSPSLDETLIDVSSCENPKLADEVTIIGKSTKDGVEVPLLTFTSWTNQNPWESLVAIPKRVSRIF